MHSEKWSNLHIDDTKWYKQWYAMIPGLDVLSATMLHAGTRCRGIELEFSCGRFPGHCRAELKLSPEGICVYVFDEKILKFWSFCEVWKWSFYMFYMFLWFMSNLCCFFVFLFVALLRSRISQQLRLPVWAVESICKESRWGIHIFVQQNSIFLK